MKKYMKYILLFVSIITVIGAFIFYVYSSEPSKEGSSDSSSPQTTTESKDKQPGVTAVVNKDIKFSEAKREENGLWTLPGSEFNAAYNWTLEDIQLAIHQMSHAKVYAAQKWGVILPTKERITSLLEITNKIGVKDDAYSKILTKWGQGDFSSLVADHNSMWKRQKGNVGEATKMLTEKEEIDYVNSTLKRNDATYDSMSLLAKK